MGGEEVGRRGEMRVKGKIEGSRKKKRREKERKDWKGIEKGDKI